MSPAVPLSARRHLPPVSVKVTVKTFIFRGVACPLMTVSVNLSVHTPLLPGLAEVAPAADALAPSPLAGEGWVEGVKERGYERLRRRHRARLQRRPGLAPGLRLAQGLEGLVQVIVQGRLVAR